MDKRIESVDSLLIETKELIPKSPWWQRVRFESVWFRWRYGKRLCLRLASGRSGPVLRQSASHTREYLLDLAEEEGSRRFAKETSPAMAVGKDTGSHSADGAGFLLVGIVRGTVLFKHPRDNSWLCLLFPAP